MGRISSVLAVVLVLLVELVVGVRLSLLDGPAGVLDLLRFFGLRFLV